MTSPADKVDVLKRYLADMKMNQTNYSYLSTCSEAFVRRAFYGMFGKGPSMPTDTSLGRISKIFWGPEKLLLQNYATSFLPKMRPRLCSTVGHPPPKAIIITSITRRTNYKKQLEHLQEEYVRLGQPLKDKTLEQLVDEVDISLSKNQTFCIQSGEGPDGQKQYLCNRTHGISWWIPASRTFDTQIHRRADNVPFVYETSQKVSVYCIDLQKRLMQIGGTSSSPSPVNSHIPLPASSAASVSGHSAPLPGAQAKASGGPATSAFVSVCVASYWRNFLRLS